MFRKYVEKPKCVFEIRLRFFQHEAERAGVFYP